MKSFKEIVADQKMEVQGLKNLMEQNIRHVLSGSKQITGALLTGSVARGDARIGPYGIYIDLAIVVEDKNDINLALLFGEDSEPGIPYHCISIADKTGIAIEVLDKEDLFSIRKMDESRIYAKNESIILYDPIGLLQKWKDEYFIITEEQIQQRALDHFFRFSYFTNDYRLEKWIHRKAYIQINQNFNVAGECYCNFLYCINKSFIPRKDWLPYLTHELKIKPGNHSLILNHLYSSTLSEQEILDKSSEIQKIGKWMEQFCKAREWL